MLRPISTQICLITVQLYCTMQEAAQGLDRVHISQLLKPLRQALDAAIIKHENETLFKAQPVMSQ